MTTTTERYTAEQIQLFIKYGESWIDNKSGEQIKDEILRQAATDATRLQSLEAENARLRDDLKFAEIAISQADRSIARLIDESKDSYVPTDAEVIDWLRRSEIDESHLDHWRTVIDDARSMHLIARNAIKED